MNPRTWFRVSGSVVSAAVLFVSGSACLTSLAWAQSSESASAGSSQASFLSAPSFRLAGAPTSIATGDLNGDGKLDLVTADGSSGKVTVSLGLGNGKFAPGVDYAAGAHPGAVIVADIDGDGRPDVIVANQSEGTVRVLLSSGNGKLQQAQTYSIGFNPAFIATGDFNGKGRMDLVVSGGSSTLLAVLPNDGRGNLGKPLVRTLSKTSTFVAVADLNQDEHADLALANDDGTISILLGAGDGSFRSTPDVIVGRGPLSSILAADFNRDGKVDLAVTLAGEKQLSVLFSKGGGGFDSSASYRVGSNPVSIALGDVDEDGIPDLLVTNQGSNSFSVLRGNADGTFASALDYVAGKGPLAAVVGDFYGSGHLDLAIINYASQTISLPLGNGDGTFRAARAYSVELQPKAVAAGNLTGGKNSDLVVTNFCGSDAACKSGTVSVMAASEDGYRLASTYSLGAGPVAVALIDADGDKNLDIVALNRNDKTISILLGLGGGSFQQQFTLPLAESPISFATGDFNHDGKTDLAVLGDCGSTKCSQPGTVEILYGTGDGGFRSAITYPVDYAPSSITVGDLNKDKNLDIVVSNSCGKSASCTTPGTATVFLGDASGKFTTGKNVALGNSPSSVALGDLSGRGILDLLVTRSTDNTIAVLRGVGDGTFQTPAVYNVGVAPGSVAIADFNGDGKLDVAVSNLGDSTVSVLYGKGDGALVAGNALPVGPGPESLTAIQNANGHRASLVTANGNSASSTMGTDITVLANIQPDATVASTTTLTSSATSSTVNQPVTLTAVVTGPAATPTGKVEFKSNGSDITGCTSKALDDTGTATCITSDLAGGTDDITAIYSDQSAVYSGSTSNTVSEVVAPLPATMTLTPSVTTTPVNGVVTFTAKVSSTTPPPPAFNGTVTFKINGKTKTDCTPQVVNGSGQAFCTTKSLTVGNGTVTATYSGDTNYNFSGTATSTVTVTPLAVTLTMTSVPSSSTVDQSVTFTTGFSPAAAITPTVPTGSVSFTINTAANSDCPPVQLNGNGQATCTTSSLIFPTDKVIATYGGDSNFTVTAATGSAQVAQSVAKATAQASVVSSSPTSAVNQSVTFKATVSAPGGLTSAIQPTGPVTFTQGGNTLCTAVTLTPASTTANPPTEATALCVYTFTKALAGGVVTATYLGDSNFLSGAFGTVNQTVGAAASKTTLLAVPNPSTVNQTVTYTATITAATSGAVAPASGTVRFTNTSANPQFDLCPSQPLTSGTPVICSYTFSASGSFNIVASFKSSDTAFGDSASDPVTQQVGASLTSVVPSSSQISSHVNEQVTLNAVVKFQQAGTAVPTGTINFVDGSIKKVICSAPAVHNQDNSVSGSCPPYAFDTAGAHPIVANYVSDSASTFQGSSSPVLVQLVTASPTTTGVGSSVNPAVVNQPLTFTAQIQPTFLGPPASPTGFVTFSAGAATLCAASPVTTVATGGTATCQAFFPSTGSYTITATYSGDNNFETSTIANLVVKVNQAATTVSVTSSPNTSVVDQPVVFTAAVTQSFPAQTIPTGTVVFVDSTTSTTLCSGSLSSASTASCTASSFNAQKHVITAAYVGDINFKTSSGSFNQIVQPGPSVVALAVTAPTPPIPISVATQSITVTAEVSPVQPGGVEPTGSVTFTSTDGAAHCSKIPLVNTKGTPTAACTITFPANDSGNVVITAQYLGDANFTSSAVPLTQAVQNFALQFVLSSGSQTGPIAITQGSSNTSDQFHSVAVNATSAPMGGFADTLVLNCVVKDSAGNTITDPLTGPICSPNPGSLTNDGVTAAKLPYTFSAAATAPVGRYTVYLTGTDSTTTQLTQAAPPVTIDVVGQAGSFSLAPGAIGTEFVTFNTASAASVSPAPTLQSFACGTIITVKGGDGNIAKEVTCSGPSTGVPITGGATTVSISVATEPPTSNSAAAMSRQSGGIATAAFWGVPLLALFAWFSRRGAPRRNFFRFLGALALMIGLGNAIGCGGGGFTPPPTQKGGAAQGTYLVQVVATDSNGAQYVAVVPLVVQSLQPQTN